jgi:Lrp/AsnC family leucine-responsive transcriptional regulator
MNIIDRKLLANLQTDCKLSYAELGQRVGLSVSAVNERLKKMGKEKIIKRYVALVDPAALGLDLTAFIQVVIDRPEHERPFRARIAALPEVQECHHVTGQYSYMLKVRVRNTAHLETLIMEKIKTLKGLVSTQTSIVLSTPKETTVLPVA